MVGVGERPPAADGDEARVAVFRQDHGCTPFKLSKKEEDWSWTLIGDLTLRVASPSTLISHNTSPTLTLAEAFHHFQGRRFTGSVWPEKSK
jgi:hypothetical protein